MVSTTWKLKRSLLQEECDIEFIWNPYGNNDIKRLNENIDIMGARFWKSDVVELMISKMNPEVTRLITIASEVTKFSTPNKFVREAFECCYSKWSCVVDIEIDWKLDSLKGSHTLPSARAMKSSFEVDVIHGSIAVDKWF
ncbi:hypothetical protein Tco_1175091 [Tanacetum coccineum]